MTSDLETEDGTLAEQWSPVTQEELKYYIYALADPRTKEIFYIGKGKGNRAYQHARAAAALSASDVETSIASRKLERIQGLLKDGLEPEILLLRHGLESEHQSYEVEASLLDFARLLDPSAEKRDVSVQLTNVAGGWHSAARGLMSAADAEALYAAEPLERDDFTARAIAFRVPRLWVPGMPMEELFEATHGWWRLGPRRTRADYAITVSKGVIRAIFSIERGSWRLRRDGDRGWERDEKPRWGFDGAPAGSEMSAFVNRDIRSWFKKGHQSPTLYVNC